MCDQISLGPSALQYLLHTGAVCSDGFLPRNRAAVGTVQTPPEICPDQSGSFSDLLAGHSITRCLYHRKV